MSGPQATTHSNRPVLTFTVGSFAFLQHHELNAIITFIFIAEKGTKRYSIFPKLSNPGRSRVGIYPWLVQLPSLYHCLLSLPPTSPKPGLGKGLLEHSVLGEGVEGERDEVSYEDTDKNHPQNVPSIILMKTNKL